MNKYPAVAALFFSTVATVMLVLAANLPGHSTAYCIVIMLVLGLIFVGSAFMWMAWTRRKS